MEIRKVTETDARAIAVLSGQLGYTFSAEETVAQISAVNSSPNDIAYVAVDGNKVVGWIHVFYNIRLESAPFCEIGGLVIEENYRGKGVGKMLIEYTKPWCMQKKCNELSVRSSTKRTGAHQFYEHLGFQETKQQKVFRINI